MGYKPVPHGVNLSLTKPDVSFARPKSARSKSSDKLFSEWVHAVEGTVAVPDAARTSLAALLTRHILRDGELVLLILKPSIWFIFLSSLRFMAAVGLLMIAAKVFDDALPYHAVAYVQAGIFLIAGRLMWAVLQWMGRLYILTDLRIIRLSGIFNIDIFDCPLRRVSQTRLTSSSKERLFGLGSIEIIPRGDEELPAVWQTIARPREIHEQIIATINRAKQSGLKCDSK